MVQTGYQTWTQTGCPPEAEAVVLVRMESPRAWAAWARATAGHSCCACMKTCAEGLDEANWRLPGRAAAVGATASVWELHPRVARRRRVASEAGRQAHAAAAWAGRGRMGCTADEDTAASAGTAVDAAGDRRASAGHGGRRRD